MVVANPAFKVFVVCTAEASPICREIVSVALKNALTHFIRGMAGTPARSSNVFLSAARTSLELTLSFSLFRPQFLSAKLILQIDLSIVHIHMMCLE